MKNADDRGWNNVKNIAGPHQGINVCTVRTKRAIVAMLGVLFVLSNSTAHAFNLLKELQSAVNEANGKTEASQKVPASAVQPTIGKAPDPLVLYATTATVPIAIKNLKLQSNINDLVKQFPSCNFRSLTPEERAEIKAHQIATCNGDGSVKNCDFDKAAECTPATIAGVGVHGLVMLFDDKKLTQYEFRLSNAPGAERPFLDALNEKYGGQLQSQVATDEESLSKLGMGEGEIDRYKQANVEERKARQSKYIWIWQSGEATMVYTRSGKNILKVMSSKRLANDSTKTKSKSDATDITKKKPSDI